MNRRRSLFLFAALILIVVVAATAAAIWKRKDGKKPPNPLALELVAKQADEALRFGPMDWIRVKPTALASYTPLTGSLKAVDSATVKAKVAGELRILSVREGMAVNKGDVVGQIDPTDYELRIQEKQAQLRQAEAQWLTAQRNAEANSQLVARGFISENSSANTISALDAAKAARDAVQFQLEQAMKALADTRLIAPISGVVAERFALPGEKLSPDNRVVSIVSTQKLEAEVAVPAQDLAGIRPGQSLRLKVEGIETEQAAKVLRINPATSGNSRNVMVYLGLESSGTSLRAGAFVQGLLPIQARAEVLAVPVNAVRDQGGRQSVWVVQQGKLEELKKKVAEFVDNGNKAIVSAINDYVIKEGKYTSLDEMVKDYFSSSSMFNILIM
ncbi:MAG: efflux RND transporter periplasmic adaptor subunit, partial [Betaproteobacteria bacterium]|nr:efflux RND transporter periplasmic adaptor subunit [Betaproteobacteria bacterium]